MIHDHCPDCERRQRKVNEVMRLVTHDIPTLAYDMKYGNHETLNEMDLGQRMGQLLPLLARLMELLNDRDLEQYGLYHWMTAWNDRGEVRRGMEKLYAVLGELLGRKPAVTTLALPEFDAATRAAVDAAVRAALDQQRSVVTATVIEDQDVVEINEGHVQRRLTGKARR